MNGVLCKSQFWDSNLTWYTQVPDLTPCFQNTILVWMPCVFLWTCGPLELYFNKKENTFPIPWSYLNVFKLILCYMTLFLTVIELIFLVQSYVQEQIWVDMSMLLSATLRIITFALVLILLQRHKTSGRRSSAVLFLFWCLLIVGVLISYRSILLHVFYYEYIMVNEVHFVIGMIYLPLIVSQLFLSAFNDASANKYDHTKKLSPLDEEPFLSKLLFSWINGLLYRGFRRILELGDMPNIRECYNSKFCYMEFKKGWAKQLRNLNVQEDYIHPDNKQKSVNTSITLALIRSFWLSALIGGVLEFLYSVIRFIPPILLNLLINYAATGEPLWKGYFYTGILFLTTLISNLCINHLVYFVIAGALQVKSALISAVYRKSLKMSNSTRRRYTVGELVNLMAVDAERLFQLSMFANLLWGAPLRMFLTIVFLWQYLGPSCLAGVAVMAVILPITGLIARQSHIVQEKQMKAKDERLKNMNEIFSGIKVLKLYAWEEAFTNQVVGIRDGEVELLKKFAYFNASVSFVWGCSPFLIAVSSFVTYIMVDENNVLDASTAFVSLTLFNMLRFSLVMIPDLISNLIQTRVSLRRLNEFFVSEELDSHCVGSKTGTEDAIEISDATLSWSLEESPVLENINLCIKRGNLVAVVGQVGAGKSSILSAMLGEMYKLNGKINLEGSTAYVPQQAWIQNATLKQNILFMRALNTTVYDKVLDSCCLRPDLQILAGGDQIEIGEKGINLSGGQKQRVSLARAVYQDADIYLLDDPLSAVDANVGKHIFQHVIGPKGMLRKKTRVLVTHSVSVLPEVDVIVVVKDGEIQEIGTYTELQEKGGPFAEFLQEHMKAELQDTTEEQSGDMESKLSRSHSSSGTIRQLSSPLVRQKSESSDFVFTDPSHLIDEEKMEIGKVKIKVYWNYLKHVGSFITFLIIFSYILYQGFEIGSNLWLSEWSNDQLLPDGSQDIPLRNKRIIVYSVFGIAEALFMLAGSMLLAVGSMRASQLLHHRMLQCVIKTPMLFFDTTPLGRILNRFGKDVDVVDTQISLCFDSWIYCFLAVIGTFIVISINTPLFVVAIIPISILYYLLQALYLATSRQLKRLESVTRSPVYNNFSESIAGVSSIRAYKTQNYFTNRSDQRVDVNQSCYYHGLIVNRWLGIRLDLLGSFVVLVTSLLVVVGRDDMDPGIVGLNLSYALSVTESLTWLVRMSSELENKIVSVERINEYSILESEAPWKIKDLQPSDNWPSDGQINYVNYSTRYRKGLDLVLKRINLHVQPQEKVGVVGRTGAGKSSLTLSLFRIIEPSGGTIVIDGLDIAKIGLHDLRAKLTIIPQDPVLYSGSLRMNLDPSNAHTDEEIWIALEHAHLKPYVTTLSEGLNHVIAEGGENLSVGQRQLACLARALLRKSKILVLDEATAAIDLETDKLIQNTIRKEFSHCTVITIAHRLHTILDSNRVIVLQNGKVVESGTPSELMQNSQSVFYSMAVDAGLI